MARLKGWVPTYKKQNFIFKRTLEATLPLPQLCLKESLGKAPGRDHWAGEAGPVPVIPDSPDRKGDNDTPELLSPKAVVKADIRP